MRAGDHLTRLRFVRKFANSRSPMRFFSPTKQSKDFKTSLKSCKQAFQHRQKQKKWLPLSTLLGRRRDRRHQRRRSPRERYAFCGQLDSQWVQDDNFGASKTETMD